MRKRQFSNSIFCSKTFAGRQMWHQHSQFSQTSILTFCKDRWLRHFPWSITQMVQTSVEVIPTLLSTHKGTFITLLILQVLIWAFTRRQFTQVMFSIRPQSKRMNGLVLMFIELKVLLAGLIPRWVLVVKMDSTTHSSQSLSQWRLWTPAKDRLSTKTHPSLLTSLLFQMKRKNKSSSLVDQLTQLLKNMVMAIISVVL